MTTQEMLDALSLKGVLPACTCGRLVSFIPRCVGGDIYTLGCPGCIRRISKCTCGRPRRWWRRS